MHCLIPSALARVSFPSLCHFSTQSVTLLCHPPHPPLSHTPPRPLNSSLILFGQAREGREAFLSFVTISCPPSSFLQLCARLPLSPPIPTLPYPLSHSHVPQHASQGCSPSSTITQPHTVSSFFEECAIHHWLYTISSAHNTCALWMTHKYLLEHILTSPYALYVHISGVSVTVSAMRCLNAHAITCSVVTRCMRSWVVSTSCDRSVVASGMHCARIGVEPVLSQIACLRLSLAIPPVQTLRIPSLGTEARTSKGGRLPPRSIDQI